MSTASDPNANDPLGIAGLQEVRYSLPEMLKEIGHERENSAFAMEKLSQTEIAKLFPKKVKRRVKRSAQ